MADAPGKPSSPPALAAVVTPAPIEIYDPPVFAPGQKVRALQSVRNDGTYPGLARGTVLIDAGDVGYVQSVGEFLQRYYIYAVDFYGRGRIVGMRQGELELIETERAEG